MNNGVRFPRSKYLRRIESIQDELQQWKQHYALAAEQLDSRWTSDLLHERALTMDYFWHELEKARQLFLQPMQWPR